MSFPPKVTLVGLAAIHGSGPRPLQRARCGFMNANREYQNKASRLL